MPDRPTTSPAELARAVRTSPTKRERIVALGRMSPDERLAAYRRGEWDFDANCLWASLYRREVPMLNGEFEFIARTMPEVRE
jgi:hypothetical protein